ncbi:hypothetical protein QCA50_007543 [Cerrena zonata]|uniref:Uncharacterized protein n=1 Tax=Cerrena zonata TaxID=2478898 RepID=A0AAW0GG57_9APHY
MNVPSNQSFSKLTIHTPADTLVHYKSTKCCVIFDTKPATWISADMPHRTRTTPCTRPWNVLSLLVGILRANRFNLSWDLAVDASEQPSSSKMCLRSCPRPRRTKTLPNHPAASTFEHLGRLPVLRNI